MGINRVAAGGCEPWEVFCNLEENLVFLCRIFAFYLTSSFQVSASDFFTHLLWTLCPVCQTCFEKHWRLLVVHWVMSRLVMLEAILFSLITSLFGQRCAFRGVITLFFFNGLEALVRLSVFRKSYYTYVNENQPLLHFLHVAYKNKQQSGAG